MSVSDDFSGTSLGSEWLVQGPSGISTGFASDGTDAWLELVTPDGNYDVWNTNNGARAMQSSADEDMTLEARFLSTPTQGYEIQGILVEQDASNWIRFDTYSDGSKLYAFAAITLNGTSANAIRVKIPGGEAPYLRVTRAGDLWTFQYSLDGESWITAGSFTQSLAISAVGVVAGNTGASTGFTAQVDYFEVGSDPLLSEDGISPAENLAPDAAADALTVIAGQALQITATTLLANDSDPDGDTLTITGITQPASGTLTDNGNGSWTYTPAGGTGSDSFTYTVSDGELTDTATVTLSVVDQPESFSDDFSGATLGAEWTVTGPSGISTALASDGTDAWLELVTPDGNYNVWNTNNGARAMQSSADEDMTLEARFLSTPTQSYEIQGILVEQDASNWIRFDTYSDGSKLYAFAAITLNGTSANAIRVKIPGGEAPYLRVTRAGDIWTFQYSLDGGTWVTAGSFTQSLAISAVGLVAGNTGASTGFTAQVDYFEVGSDPLTSEDGAVVTDNLAPAAADDSLSTAPATGLTFTASDLLANDSDPDNDLLTISSISQPVNGVIVDNGGGSWTYTPTGSFTGTDTFTYTVSDGALTDTATVSITVAQPAEPISDDFSGAALDANWSIEGPSGISYALGSDSEDAWLALVTPDGAYDPWNTNRSARAMQLMSDEDFEMTARFLSVPTQGFSGQGFLVEQDEGNWLRFDTYSDGSKLYAYAAITLGGSSSMAFRVAITEGVAPYLRLVRSGDTYTFSYSQDGESWVVAGSLTQDIAVTSGGLFASNSGQATGFTALIDYFELASDPLVSEDGVYNPPLVEDDAFATAPDTALIITAAQLLGNDTSVAGGTLQVASVGTPFYGTLTDNGNGTWTYTPPTGYQGIESFTYTASDGFAQATADVTITVGTPPAPAFSSDDFAAAALAPFWEITTAASGTGYSFGGTATDAYIALSTDNGNFDLWGSTVKATRAMQGVSDEDMVLEAHLLSTPSRAHQMQGFLIQQDAETWLRFDFYHDGSRLYAFAAATVGGSTSNRIKVAISAADAAYLRVERVSDSFEMFYSADGASWTSAGSLTQALTVTETGIFAASVGASSGFSALFDYAEVGSDPLLDEDGSYEPAPAPPVLGDDLFKMLPGTSLSFTAADLLANDSDINGDTLTITGFSVPGNGTITALGGGNYLYTPSGSFEGTDSFTYTVSDGSNSVEASVSVVVRAFDAISDDFAGGTLDPAWTFEGIAGGASIGYLENDAVAVITSPAGVKVSASDVMTTPRILQSVSDVDFVISAGFLTVPSAQYQEHGLLVVQDDENWLRFDLAYTGGSLSLIVGTIVDGDTTYPLFTSVGVGVVEEFRIIRSGDTWIFETRGSGSDWSGAYTFDRAMSVTQVGAFAGSTSNGTDSDVPGYSAYLDYFENSLDPITDEDAGLVVENYAPTAYDDTFAVFDALTFDLQELLANDFDANLDDPLVLTAIGSPVNGTLTQQPDGSYLYVPNEGFEGTESIDYTISDGEFTSTATITLDVQQALDIWYGTTQSFGSPGETQRWINILGTAAAEVVSLSYSLNGGTARELSIGPDTRRLRADGDFNIDIAFSELDGSTTDDVVTIIAQLETSESVTQDVVIEYEDGADWPKSYTIDWSTVTNLQDVVQVVDGTWEITEDGLRPVDLGYDRLVTLGDSSWDNYRLETVITTFDLTNEDPRGRDGGGFAIGLLWGGHTEDPVPNMQPASGWNPGASFFYTSKLASHSYHDYSSKLGQNSLTLAEDKSYNLVVEVGQTGLYDRVYSIRIWEVGQTEPSGWTLQTTETFSLEEAPATGSIYLNAHYYDVAFGDITVTEITGRDIVNGTDGDDLLSAVDPAGTLPGVGEIDVLAGGAGADAFVLGDSSKAYYDDGLAGTDGLADYAFVWDFDAAEDVIALHGMAIDYELREDVAGLTAGTSIWRIVDGDAELICVLNGAYGLTLGSGSFSYTGGLLA